MGGRHGAAKVAIERPENKKRLCRVCHVASHGCKVIESDGFWCGLCPRVHECRFGARLADLPLQHMTPLWGH
jgi:hypothetical protein